MTGRTPRGAARLLRATAQRRSGEWYYRRRLREPVDPLLAVFGIYWYRGYGCNPKAVYEMARTMVPGLRGVWVVSADRVDQVPDGVEHVVAGSRAYYDVIARAGVFVNNVNFPTDLVKRPGTVHVMTHHGTPLKHMGMDLKGRATREGASDFDALLRRCARWDFSVSQNRHSTEIWERVFPGTYESLEVGHPRNDLLANATADDVDRARRSLGITGDQRVVLYAPTHRDHVHGTLPHLDSAALAEQLGEGWVVLSRLHHLYDEPSVNRLTEARRLLDVTSHPSVEELCLAADFLVTDYSSIMFDYAVLDRPIVIHAPDWEEYRAARGVYFDLQADPPGPVVSTQAEVVEALLAPADRRSEEVRAAFRERFCALDDGQAARKVVERAWAGRLGHAPAS